MNNFLIALLLCISSITIYKIAYSKAPFLLRIFWIVGLVVAMRAFILQ
jgi:uncharacterized integral membrane protein